VPSDRASASAGDLNTSRPVPTYRLDIAYDGAPFRGWAAQPGLRTVQGEIEAGLARIGSPAKLTVAGRTDTGVHAWGQVASMELEQAPRLDLRRSLDAVVPAEIAILGAAEAPAGFDARRQARSRTYCYRVAASPVASPFEAGRALWWPYALDRAVLDACARATAGTHDFTAFTPTQTEHVRFERDVMRCEWREGKGIGPEPVLELWIEADAFMRNMVRALVGTMLEAAAGRRTPADFAALLEGAPRERGGDTAPAHGLYLAAVSY
jgi:tRNA pseudouridine38-40 synthase